MQSLTRLVFGPLLFQAALVLKRRGVLGCLVRGAARGLELGELEAVTGLGHYALTVLLDAAEASGLVERHQDRFYPTRSGLLLERDALTSVNLNFVADVCYAAAQHLDESIERGEAAGLAELGSFANVYQGLSSLAPRAQRSWLEFDHFYSDGMFAAAVELLGAVAVRSVLDVGGNTGRFAVAVCRALPEVRMTLADLPGQLEMARAHLSAAGVSDRVALAPVDVLRADSKLPQGHDLVWMSQFLCCFSEAEIVHILRQALAALSESGQLWIVDTFIDQQPTKAGAMALEATSLYFTCVANGKGRMYRLTDLERCLDQAGLRVVNQIGPLGVGHTLLKCERVDAVLRPD